MGNNYDELKAYIEDLTLEEMRNMYKPCDENGVIHIIGGLTKDNYVLNDIYHKCEHWDRCKREKKCWELVDSSIMFPDKR